MNPCDTELSPLSGTREGKKFMVQLTANVTGLTCQHCVSTVTTALEAVEGVDAVTVDLVNGGESRVILGVSTHDDLLATIAQALATEGYTLTSMSARDN